MCKQKYNLSCLRLGDRQPREEIVESESSKYAEYGYRSLKFEMCCRHDNIVECQLFIVQKKDRATLLPIIQREIDY
ncbi:DDE Tnp IS1595 domain-containing protein [Aphis craccivora]|uniref:DDE Tnp IS1595 domain-containing protein n=1 Tax=Aphis craccivora TaxID=307492 RepID=A0A6G0YCT2_APHCR|nr:DDE Tnp IS1595 domain-containing protein [Aphis craccivora]